MHAASRHSSDTTKQMASPVDKGKGRTKKFITNYIVPPKKRYKNPFDPLLNIPNMMHFVRE
jgi:hypothetical protein